MNTQRISRSVRRVVAFVVEEILPDLPAGSRLPTVRSIAARCKASASTVVRAIAHLQSKGIVSVIGRGGVVVGAVQSAAVDVFEPRPPKPSSAAEAIGARVLEDILSGHLPVGSTLPPYKEMAGLYGGCYTTIKRSLESLEASGRLVRKGKKFGVAVSVSQREGHRIVFLASHNRIGALLNATPSAPVIWNGLSTGCNRMGIQLHLHGYFGFYREGIGENYLAHFESMLRRDRDKILGVVLWSTGDPKRYAEPCYLAALSHGKPSVVIGETSSTPDEAPLQRLRHSRLLRWYPVGTDILSGKTVGNALLDMGHRRVACFAPGAKGSPSWAAVRWKGLEETFRLAGERADVRRFHLSSSYEPQPNAPEEFREGRAMQEQALADAGPEWFKRDRQVFSPVDSSLARRRLAAALEPAFDEALSDPSITAWVGFNDDVALAALEYLEHRKVAVPQTLSVAGFDNTHQAPGEGLTSYDFNPQAAVDQALRFITKDVHAQRSSRIVRTLPGMLIRRRSLGRASRRVDV